MLTLLGTLDACTVSCPEYQKSGNRGVDYVSQ